MSAIVNDGRRTSLWLTMPAAQAKAGGSGDQRSREQSMGPLADEPPAEPRLRPVYGPTRGAQTGGATPRGFFLDRYVY